jgi:hypothetical protein
VEAFRLGVFKAEFGWQLGYRHGVLAALISTIYLCCGGTTVELPTER